MHSARVSIGKTSLAVRYAELAPADATKKIAMPKNVSVQAVSPPIIRPATASITPETMYVPEIIRTRPTLSNSGPSASAPRKLLTANSAM
jgi:hypothetical protein